MKQIIKYFLFIILFMSSFQGQSQYLFQKYYGAGSMFGRKIITTPTGYILIGFYNLPSGNLDNMIAKTDFNGNIIWSKTFGNLMLETVSDAIISNDGFLVISGNIALVSSWDESDIIIIKMDPGNGNIVWENYYEMTIGDYSTTISETPDFGFILTGMVNSAQSGTGQHLWKSMLLKIDSVGHLEWFNYFILPNFEARGLSTIATRDSMYALTGFKKGGFYTADTLLYFIKVNLQGYPGINHVYRFTNTGLLPANSTGTCMMQNDSGELIIAGYLHGPDSSGLYRQIPFITKTDSVGNILTSKSYAIDNSGYASLSYIKKHPSGGYLACGQNSQNTLLMLKVDENLNTEWCFEYSFNNIGNLSYEPQFDFTIDKGLVIVEATGLFFQGTTILLTTDSLGHAACNYQTPLLLGVSTNLTDTMVSITNNVTTGGWKYSNQLTIQSITISDSLICDAIVSASNEDEYNLFSMYPNPSNGIVKLRVNTDLDKIKMISVINAIGFEVYTYGNIVQNGETELKLSHLSPGVYIVSVYCENNKILHKKFVKY